MPKMNVKRLAASLICVTILIFLAVFVWPTRFWYANDQHHLIRIDRFTDQMSYLDTDDGKWTAFKPSTTLTSTKADDELDKLLRQMPTTGKE